MNINHSIARRRLLDALIATNASEDVLEVQRRHLIDVQSSAGPFDANGISDEIEDGLDDADRVFMAM